MAGKCSVGLAEVCISQADPALELFFFTSCKSRRRLTSRHCFFFIRTNLPLTLSDVASLVIGVPGNKPEDEPPQTEGANGEDRVANHA